MKKATILITIIGTLASLAAVTCLAQSFMNYGGSAPNTGSSTAPKMAPGGKITTLSADDFKSRVTTLGRKNQEKLAQQVQEMIPPSSTGSGADSTPTASKASSTSTTTSSSQPAAPSQPAAAPAAPRNSYSGFGTGGTGSSAPASSGSSTGSGGFGIKY